MKDRDVSKHGRRDDRLIRERVHDPYKTRLKLTDPAVCPNCGAVYLSDRWTWEPAPAGAEETRCQACHRIRDKFPAGVVTLSGAFLAAHRDDILNLARHTEDQEKAEHPLHRIMEIRDEDGATVIETTDIHLPRRIGEAIEKAYRGTLDFHYEEEAYFLRVRWTRDD